MINREIRQYDFYQLTPNGYGQLVLPATPQIAGTIQLAISITSQSVQANINYQSAQYVGFTTSSLLDDTCIIQYGDKRLKVLYINAAGRYKQIFLSEYEH